MAAGGENEKIPETVLKYRDLRYQDCDPDGTRTHNLQNRNLAFYPIELRDHDGMGVDVWVWVCMCVQI